MLDLTKVYKKRATDILIGPFVSSVMPSQLVERALTTKAYFVTPVANILLTFENLCFKF